MERIKSQTSATLDRMALLQERYRQHQEIMRSGGESSRRNSNASQIDEQQLVSEMELHIVANTTYICLPDVFLFVDNKNSLSLPLEVDTLTLVEIHPINGRILRLMLGCVQAACRPA